MATGIYIFSICPSVITIFVTRSHTDFIVVLALLVMILATGHTMDCGTPHLVPLGIPFL